MNELYITNDIKSNRGKSTYEVLGALALARGKSDPYSFFNKRKLLCVQEIKNIIPENYTLFLDSSELNEYFSQPYNDWYSTLTKEEKKVIMTYVAGGNCEKLNGVLRGFRYPQENELSDIENLSRAVKKFMIPENIVLFRGCGKNIIPAEKIKNPETLVGYTISDKGFMSTSVLPGLDKPIVGRDDLYLIIKAPKGTRGAYLGKELCKDFYEHENELLLDKGQNLVVQNVFCDQRRLQTILICEVTEQTQRS